MDARACTGCLLGTAAGDALGLPYEGLTARRASRLFPDKGRHHLLPGKGMVSDDTEHACLTARALLLADGDVDRFGRELASSLRWWLAGLPVGIGMATLRAVVKSCLGFPPERSGVFSAGNGPAMRSAIIGVALGDSPGALCDFVRRSTQLTHTDPKAYQGALAVAAAAHHGASRPVVSAGEFLQQLELLLEGESADEFIALARKAASSAAKGEPVATFAESIGSRGGISGYMFHTVPCVLQVWLSHPDDYAGGVRELIEAGGDTDTAAAILGGIAGARNGKESIPQAWLGNILEWPRSMAWVEQLGLALASDGARQGRSCPAYFVPGVALRNLVFLVIVLAHGFRRLAPPY
ncbi:MAG: ADP-ribosylglycohydrolase family protein [Pseudomonadota bacterium]